MERGVPCPLSLASFGSDKGGLLLGSDGSVAPPGPSFPHFLVGMIPMMVVMAETLM